jgi:hypothetical protein
VLVSLITERKQQGHVENYIKLGFMNCMPDIVGVIKSVRINKTNRDCISHRRDKELT